MGGKYEGTWQMGKQHGYGVIIDEKGTRKKGFWENGRRVMWVEGDSPGLKRK